MPPRVTERARGHIPGQATNHELNPNCWSGLDGNNTGNNPFNTSITARLRLLDPTNAGVTSATGTWNSTFTIFTLTIDGTQTNPKLSPWSVVGLAAPTNNSLSDQSGTYTNYSLTLTANFASPATLNRPGTTGTRRPPTRPR